MAVGVHANLLAWLPRILVLAAIWGIAIFLWGTFGAWTHRQYVHHEQELLRQQSAAIRAWLAEAIAPLDRLANDSRIVDGIDLPAGVESLPVQRVLYEFSYLSRQSEVYVVDLLRKRVGRTAGAAPLPAEVTQRLADIPDAERTLMGMGARNGQILLARRIDAPLPNRLLAVLPVSLATLSTSQPTVELAAERKFGIVVPHPTGWAKWHDGQRGFDMDPHLNEAMQARLQTYETPPLLNVLEPLKGWPSVWLAMETEASAGGTRLLPQLLVLLWAVMMSALVLNNVGKTYREKAMAKLGPVIKPVEKVALLVFGKARSLGEVLAARWHAINKETPLVDGPGGLGKQDFIGASEMALNAAAKRGRGTKRPGLNQATAKTATKGTVKPRPPQAGKPSMAWPDDKAGSDEAETSFDNSDMLQVIEDCLQKKRIRLLYQPIYRSSDGMPVMHEVYARLVRATGEVITPDVFLPLAIKNRLVLDLDIAVLRKVVHDQFGNGNTPMTPLALNISSTSLDGIAYLQEMANQGPRILRKVSFEVRSQEMIRDPKALRLLKDLQRHGGNLAVDYFGGGNAMLEASKSIGFNYVKLNCRKFLETDGGKVELLGLCNHARSLGLPIILEMVGDTKALDVAYSCGAEFLQGYALARPGETMTMEKLPPNINEIAPLAAMP